MSGIFDQRLFSIGDTPVTIASLVVAILFVVGSFLLGKLSQRLVSQKLLARTNLSVGVRYVLGRFTGYLVLFLGIAIALQTLGIRATTLAAFGAALGVGIGFGLQDIVKNFVAGLILLVERPFQVGDRIEIDKVGAEVVEIRARATILRTNDDVHLIVPNAKFMTETVVNRTFGRPIYRLHVPVLVAFGADPGAVEDALLDAARACEGVLQEPPAAVRFRESGESTLRFELLAWTARMVHRPGALISQLNVQIHESLRRRGVALPSSQIDVRIREAAQEGPGATGPGRDAPA
jgi:potassium-dependent mechanosensitive channel